MYVQNLGLGTCLGEAWHLRMEHQVMVNYQVKGSSYLPCSAWLPGRYYRQVPTYLGSRCIPVKQMVQVLLMHPSTSRRLAQSPVPPYIHPWWLPCTAEEENRTETGRKSDGLPQK